MLLFNRGFTEKKIFYQIVSIHPMLLFNNLIGKVGIDSMPFQYIPCYCSTWSNVVPVYKKNCFNTSHVTVQRIDSNLKNFTPHSFNTSHVTVQPPMLHLIVEFICVSIHPMLLFNSFYWQGNRCVSNVSIHPMLLFNNFGLL